MRTRSALRTHAAASAAVRHVRREFVEAWAKYLESLKQAKSVEDAIAAQAHFFSDTHEKLKTNSLETLQTLGSVRIALTAWTEKTIDNAAEEENVPQAVASKRAASK